mmetsp:Transcript_24101/g.90942  ORF Transcript_24101/g.90942 Transcript_24101/m.90942 type:complete len:208 (+) Transcript_24101:1175-1798(+)
MRCGRRGCQLPCSLRSRSSPRQSRALHGAARGPGTEPPPPSARALPAAWTPCLCRPASGKRSGLLVLRRCAASQRRPWPSPRAVPPRSWAQTPPTWPPRERASCCSTRPTTPRQCGRLQSCWRPRWRPQGAGRAGSGGRTLSASCLPARTTARRPTWWGPSCRCWQSLGTCSWRRRTPPRRSPPWRWAWRQRSGGAGGAGESRPPAR